VPRRNSALHFWLELADEDGKALFTSESSLFHH
jgi:hypothetical protein